MRQMARFAILVGTLFGIVASANVLAQPFPTKPVRLVVPYPPGGGADFHARALQKELSEVLGQPIVVDNRSGASGMIGTESVAKSPADGYTLLLTNLAIFAINPSILQKVPYDPLKHFTPVVHTADLPYVLAVHPSLPVRTVNELVQYGRANPGKLSYGSAGSGSLHHLAAESFKAQTGVDMVHVPYKGAAPMVVDLVAGRVQLSFGDQAVLMPHVAEGRLRAVAVTSLRRSPVLPDVPTMAEAGLRDLEVKSWQGVVGPAGMPPEVVKTLNEALNKVLRMPAVTERLKGGRLDPVGGTPEEFGKLISSEASRWSAVVKQAGIKPE